MTEMAYAFGSLVGPILGGVLYDRFNFSTTTDIFAILCLIFAFFQIIVVLIPDFRGKDKITFEPLPE